MSTISNFQFDTTAVRAIERDSQPWFIAADVCAAIGITNHRDAVARLDADERGAVEVDTLGGRQSVTAINESGLYALMLRSRDAMTPGSVAHRFRKWVTAEVLPALRRDGGYGRTAGIPALDDPAALRTLLLGYSERILELEGNAASLTMENATLAPKATALDRIATAEGSMNITAAAKALQVRPRWLGKWLQSNRWTYREKRRVGAQGFQAKLNAGLLEHKIAIVDYGDRRRAVGQLLVTPKGITKLAELLANEGVLA